MSYKRKSKFVISISLVLTLLFSVVATTVSAYAAPTSNKDGFFGDDWDDDWDDFSKGDWSGVDASNVKLINTKQWALSGILKIEVAYVTDEVKLLPSPTQEIILKEYLSEDSPRYHANTSIVDSTLKIERGERPAPSPTGYISNIEIYVPANFSGEIKLVTESGCIAVTDYKGKLNCNTETGLITILDSKIDGNLSSNSGIITCTRTGTATDKGKLNCNTDSGLIIFSDSAFSGTLDTNSGIIELGITKLLGDVDAHSDSGHVMVDISSSASFSIKATTDTGAVKNNFSNSFTTSKNLLVGEWGTTPTNKINLSSDSGGIVINQK